MYKRQVLGGETVLAGNRRLLEEHGVDVSSLVSDAERLSAQGQTPMYFAKGGTLLGLSLIHISPLRTSL